MKPASGLILLAVFTLPLGAQWSNQPTAPTVNVTPVAPVTVAAGKSTQVPIRFTLTKGFHVNSNVPRSELLIPTVLTLKPPAPEVSFQVIYPKGEDLAFEFAPEEKLNVYSGEFILNVRVKAARTAASGTHQIAGELRYQACNDRACFPPKKIPVTFDLMVTKLSRSAGVRVGEPREPTGSPQAKP